MARTNERFVNAHNMLLTHCKKIEISDTLPSENSLSDLLGVSRTVVRSVLSRFHEEGIITLSGRKRLLNRAPRKSDFLSPPPTLISIDELENRFLDWVLRMDVPPGEVLNVTQLAKDFCVAPHTLQEFLSSLNRFGIVHRRPKGGWVLNGFTANYAVELSDFRTVLELNSVKHLIALPEAHEIWGQIEQLERKHRSLLERIETSFHDFSQLNEQFHTTVNSVVTNRFVKQFQKVISLIFHYHFQWNKSDERLRNEAAISEHLAYIDALKSRDWDQAEQAARRHLQTSKATLLNSLEANGHIL
ncbi:GntR family transcriptional regulator [Cognatishimia maritima]|uniref:DNA-binding transcriptional regulator, GntR family n=1 Tax=Cognatishimia maritima TaxID=870908 RepID=A0A1M5QTV8_9RHOB|nr:GntR family transcriptional regulator [Cognatishimia maritima]SHH17564.1 DNA-binding transcriptional regulator, GntR family [Cognatishimia maritima]